MNKIILGIGGTVCVIGGLSYAAASQTTPNTTALAAWSQYIDTDGIAGRFILDGIDKTCSDFKFKDVDSSNSVAATQRDNPSKNGNTNDVDTDLAALFPVTVCQGTLGKTWETVEIIDSKNNPIQVNSSGKDENGNFIPLALTLPGPASVGQQHVDETILVTLGDSGCQYTNPSDPRNRCNLTDYVSKATIPNGLHSLRSNEQTDRPSSIRKKAERITLTTDVVQRQKRQVSRAG